MKDRPGKTVHKSTALRLIFSSDPKSTDRLKRVAGLPRLGTCNETNNWLNDTCFKVRDPFAVLVTCGDVHTLATFSADKLQNPTAKGTLFRSLHQCCVPVQPIGRVYSQLLWQPSTSVVLEWNTGSMLRSALH